MAAHPAIGIRFTPCGLAIDASKPFGNDIFFFMFFVPYRPFGFVHHLVTADDGVLTQAQETVEK